jgi:hypothetical protein
MNYAVPFPSPATCPPLLSAPGAGQVKPTAVPARTAAPAGRGGGGPRPVPVFLIVVMSLPLLSALGVASYFYLGSATRALRNSVMETVPGTWDKTVAVSVGNLTLGAVRFGAQFFPLPPEAKAALSAVHGAEVGLYQLEETPEPVPAAALFATADRRMKWRGWERVVGVAQGRQFVAVYVPRNFSSLERAACCVVVLNHQDLVVASVRGNLEPLLKIARQHLHDEPEFRDIMGQ